jgi:hypothetical protein
MRPVDAACGSPDYKTNASETHEEAAPPAAIEVVPVVECQPT